MCGICGIVDLVAARDIDRVTLLRMADAVAHRGPDDSGCFLAPGVGLAARRLSIVGLDDGHQPMFNDDGTVAVVFNGEIFDYPERRAELSARGHRFTTSCDTEVLIHAWEEEGEGMLPRLRGQFAFALFDARRRLLILARDPVGIVPLHWTRRGDWLYFGSEIKALLASSAVPAEADCRGIDHAFTFMGLAGRRTAFRNVNAIAPGSYLRVEFGRTSTPAIIREQVYHDFTFPETSDDYDRRPERALLADFDRILTEAVSIRLRADVPVAGYLSGGVDSTTVVSTAARVLGRTIPTFTIRIPSKRYDETDRAQLAARVLGSTTTIVNGDSETIRRLYPSLIIAAEAPVLDTACAAMYRQAEEVRGAGYKVVITGEGADDALAGYPWLKAGKAIGLLDLGQTAFSNALRRIATIAAGRRAQWPRLRRLQDAVGGPNGLFDFYSVVSVTRRRFYSQTMLETLGESSAFDDVALNRDQLRRWHPLNRALYLGYKTLVPGLLMSQKGDRPAMHNSVETRHPFLDSRVVEFCARLPPSLKLRGLLADKYLLRRYASRMLPAEIAWRRKAMFRAPFGESFFGGGRSFVDELLSDDSLRTTGYFDRARVHEARDLWRHAHLRPIERFVVELGLTGVVATQLWHHTFVAGTLCSLPTWSAAPRAATAAANTATTA